MFDIFLHIANIEKTVKIFNIGMFSLSFVILNLYKIFNMQKLKVRLYHFIIALLLIYMYMCKERRRGERCMLLV